MQCNRRIFLQNLTGFAVAVGLGASGKKLLAMNIKGITSGCGNSAIIPRPIQVVIDDVGWWSGRDGSDKDEPYRTGINRNHVVADYQAIIQLGRALGIRPQAAMVLCEWDRENILATCLKVHGWEKNGITDNGLAPGWRKLQILSVTTQIILSLPFMVSGMNTGRTE